MQKTKNYQCIFTIEQSTYTWPATYLNTFQHPWRLGVLESILLSPVLERTSNEAFQVLWAEFSFENRKKIVESFIDSITHLKSFNHILMRLLQSLRP